MIIKKYNNNYYFCVSLKKKNVKYEFFHFLYSTNHDITINHNGIVPLFRLLACLKEFII